MWTIGEMKSRGWERVSRYFQAAYGVVVISFILGLIFNAEANPLLNLHGTSHLLEQMSFLGPVAGLFLLLTFQAMALVISLASILFKFFVLNPIEVGTCLFFLESRERGESAGVETIFRIFKSRSYGNVVKVMFFRDLYIFLWMLLLVIPGIYKSLQYQMIPYLLAEHPEMSSQDAFDRTKALMEDQCLHLLGLQFSFIGWALLCCLLGSLASFAIGMIFPVNWLKIWVSGAVTLLVTPYLQATVTELYIYLRYDKQSDGNASQWEVN